MDAVEGDLAVLPGAILEGADLAGLDQGLELGLVADVLDHGVTLDRAGEHDGAVAAGAEDLVEQATLPLEVEPVGSVAQGVVRPGARAGLTEDLEQVAVVVANRGGGPERLLPPVERRRGCRG